MVGLVPTIHPTACSAVRGALDPRDKTEDDNGNHLLEAEHYRRTLMPGTDEDMSLWSGSSTIPAT
jgi:hypothetical protein